MKDSDLRMMKLILKGLELTFDEAVELIKVIIERIKQ